MDPQNIHQMGQAVSALIWSASGLIASVIILLWIVIAYVSALARSVDSHINTVAVPSEPEAKSEIWRRVADGLADNSRLHLRRP